MTFDDIIALRDEVLDVVVRQLPEGRVVDYQMAGGQQSSNPWEAAGLFAEIVGKGRVVLEALYLAERGVCLLRVYREDSFDVLSTTLMERLEPEDAVAAGQVFVAALQNQELAAIAAERQQFRESDLPDVVERVLNPLPPPIPPETWQRRTH